MSLDTSPAPRAAPFPTLAGWQPALQAAGAYRVARAACPRVSLDASPAPQHCAHLSTATPTIPQPHHGL
ncbi:MAG TPA: hypothetical protein VH540_20785 [Ktedonobacterales bacterium]